MFQANPARTSSASAPTSAPTTTPNSETHPRHIAPNGSNLAHSGLIWLIRLIGFNLAHSANRANYASWTDYLQRTQHGRHPQGCRPCIFCHVSGSAPMGRHHRHDSVSIIVCQLFNNNFLSFAVGNFHVYAGNHLFSSHFHTVEVVVSFCAVVNSFDSD